MWINHEKLKKKTQGKHPKSHQLHSPDILCKVMYGILLRAIDYTICRGVCWLDVMFITYVTV